MKKRTPRQDIEFITGKPATKEEITFYKKNSTISGNVNGGWICLSCNAEGGQDDVVVHNSRCPFWFKQNTPPETGREWEKVMEQLRKFFFMCGVMRVEPTLEEFTKIISPLLLSEHQRWVDKEIEYLDKNAVATDGDTLFVKIRKSSMKDAFSLIAGEKEGV